MSCSTSLSSAPVSSREKIKERHWHNDSVYPIEKRRSAFVHLHQMCPVNLQVGSLTHVASPSVWKRRKKLEKEWDPFNYKSMFPTQVQVTERWRFPGWIVTHDLSVFNNPFLSSAITALRSESDGSNLLARTELWHYERAKPFSRDFVQLLMLPQRLVFIFTFKATTKGSGQSSSLSNLSLEQISCFWWKWKFPIVK